MHFAISDLRDCADFAPTVADRVWRAWWKPKGTTLDDIAARVADSLRPCGFPIALVAHEGADFVGTASLIASDLRERPDLTPWLAAVWVEPARRGRGVGASLVSAVAHRAFAMGFDRLHLCALADKAGFYAGLGWSVSETDVGPKRLTIMSRRSPGTEAREE